MSFGAPRLTAVLAVMMCATQAYASGEAGVGPQELARIAPAAEPEIVTIVKAYLHGDSVDALAQLNQPGRFVLVSLDPALQAALALMHTELAINARTFGRISWSAPLVAAKPSVGLTGMYEPDSLIANRQMKAVLGTRQASQTALVGVVRDWYILAVSYCLRWKLDAADALLAEVRAEFADDPAILLLAGSVAETRGRLREAELFLRHAVALDDTLTEAQLRLGRVLLRTGKTTEARRSLDRVLARTSNGAAPFSRHFALLLLADLDQRAGQTTRAGARRAEAAKTMPVEAGVLTREGLTPWQLYASAQFWQQSAGIRIMRQALATASAAK